MMLLLHQRVTHLFFSCFALFCIFFRYTYGKPVLGSATYSLFIEGVDGQTIKFDAQTIIVSCNTGKRLHWQTDFWLSLIAEFIDRLNRLLGLFIDWLIDSDSLTDWLNNPLTQSLTHLFSHWLIDSLTDWLVTDWLTDWQTHSLTWSLTYWYMLSHLFVNWSWLID